MSWLGLLLIGFAVADLGHSIRPVRHIPEAIGAVVAVTFGLLAGMGGLRDFIALAVIAAAVLAWGFTVRRGFGREQAWLPLGLLAGVLALGVVLAPWAGRPTGPWADWVDKAPWGFADASPEQVLLALGALAVQCSTGNVIVRLVLAATGTVNPMSHPMSHPMSTAQDEPALKGGRLLGPMERLVILGLGLTGNVTAAGLVIAAKGLIRWPEIQSFGRSSNQPTITEVTEYFLVGSFASWLVALGALALVA